MDDVRQPSIHPRDRQSARVRKRESNGSQIRTYFWLSPHPDQPTSRNQHHPFVQHGRSPAADDDVFISSASSSSGKYNKISRAAINSVYQRSQDAPLRSFGSLARWLLRVSSSHDDHHQHRKRNNATIVAAFPDWLWALGSGGNERASVVLHDGLLVFVLSCYRNANKYGVALLVVPSYKTTSKTANATI